MSLANSYKTRIIEPVVHVNYRSEFNFPAEVLLSNPRLINVGAYITGTSKNSQYAHNTGAACVIDRISLYADNELISQCRNVYQYLGFKNMKEPNAYNYNVQNLSQRIAGGYTYETAAGDGRMDYKSGTDLNASVVLTNSEATTPKGRLPLNMVLEFFNARAVKDKQLEAFPYVLANKMKNLRLVIDYQTGAPDTIFHVGTNTFTGWAPTRPLLVVDQVMDPKGIDMNPLLVYSQPTFERIVIPPAIDNTVNPAVPTTVPSQVELQSMKDKFVTRMVLINDVGPVSGLKQASSQAMKNEKINFVVNGKYLLPYEGIDSFAKKMYHATNGIGDLNIATVGGYCYDMVDKELVSNNRAELITKFSYGGIEVNQKIDKLQLNYQRTGLDDDVQANAFNLNVFGFTRQTLQVNDDGSVVVTSL